MSKNHKAFHEIQCVCAIWNWLYWNSHENQFEKESGHCGTL